MIVQAYFGVTEQTINYSFAFGLFVIDYKKNGKLKFVSGPKLHSKNIYGLSSLRFTKQTKNYSFVFGLFVTDLERNSKLKIVLGLNLQSKYLNDPSLLLSKYVCPPMWARLSNEILLAK